MCLCAPGVLWPANAGRLVVLVSVVSEEAVDVLARPAPGFAPLFGDLLSAGALSGYCGYLHRRRVRRRLNKGFGASTLHIVIRGHLVLELCGRIDGEMTCIGTAVIIPNDAGCVFGLICVSNPVIRVLVVRSMSIRDASASVGLFTFSAPSQRELQEDRARKRKL
jgi:hypothetical protein